LKESVIHGDETPLQVLHEPGREAKNKSYEWVYRTSGCSDKKIIFYDYKETRRQEHPQAFLKDFKGYLHTDGSDVYHNLTPDIIIVGCWAHARRYWENALKVITQQDKRKDSDAARGLTYVNRLFELEREFKDLTPDERYEKRITTSKPVSDSFFDWVEKLGALPLSLLGKASQYTLSQRKYLENVFLDGRLELSNNRCERSVKPFVMGRKAWLFSNTPNGAHASSIMYSIIETAKENGLHPYFYIKFLLETLPNVTTDHVAALLPWSDSLPDSCFVPIKNKPCYDLI
jgi:transposase